MSSSDQTPAAVPAFADFDLPEPLLRALGDLGYEQPTPIQAATLPPLLAGKDLVGQAQTGTGKTAAFALPALARINPQDKRTQVLVLTPTRELCIQVAEAFQQYAKHLTGFRVLPVYGGTEFRGQLRGLKHGSHVVVGTPGRLMDHMRRGTIDLSGLTTVILDEGDEMLRMGFIDDVEWILEQTPATRQTALFSATMPGPVRRIASKFLNQPEEVTIESNQRTADTIRQRFWLVDGMQKLDALTRILETEEFDGMLVFVRTKIETEELSRRLEARGWASTPLNGDIAQAQREKVVERFKSGRFDVLVATDVVARGLDVDRISHVINYDIPYDPEAYVHRIGRTGRAGRSGEAILFVSRRERGMLRAIERSTDQRIERMDVPSTDEVNQHRMRRFHVKISETLATGEDLDQFQDLVESFQHDEAVPMERIAAALACMAQGERPLFSKEVSKESNEPYRQDSAGRFDQGSSRAARGDSRGDSRGERGPRPPRGPDGPRGDRPKRDDANMETYRIEVGRNHGVQPGNIVGAIANEAGIDAQHIGRIFIRDDHSLVDLPEGMPPPMFKHLKNVWVSGQKLMISKQGEAADAAAKTAAAPTPRHIPADSRSAPGTRPGVQAGAQAGQDSGPAAPSAKKSKRNKKPDNRPAKGDTHGLDTGAGGPDHSQAKQRIDNQPAATSQPDAARDAAPIESFADRPPRKRTLSRAINLDTPDNPDASRAAPGSTDRAPGIKPGQNTGPDKSDKKARKGAKKSYTKKLGKKSKKPGKRPKPGPKKNS